MYAGQSSHIWIRLLISALILAGILAFALSGWSKAAALDRSPGGAKDPDASMPDLSPLIWHEKGYFPVRDGCTPV